MTSSDVMSRHRPCVFLSQLTGDQEVPKVQTFTRAHLRMVWDGCELRYVLSIHDSVELTQAHLHLGRPGMNGPVVAFLYENSGPTGKLNVAVREGQIQDKDLIGPLAGKTLLDLIREIRQCNIYVNVHTARNPNGEVRGQVLPEHASCDICRRKPCPPKCKCPKPCHCPKPCKCPKPCRCGQGRRDRDDESWSE